jgi:hypothetical protein
MKRSSKSIWIAGAAFALCSFGIRAFLSPARYVAPVRVGDYRTRPVSSALVAAAGVGDLKTVQRLLDNGVSPNAVAPVSGDEGCSALEAAAGSGSTPVVQLLLDRGADVNAPSPWGATAMTGAAIGGYPDTVQLLISRGADVNSDDDGTTPLAYVLHAKGAATGKEKVAYERVLKLLRAAGARRTPWF